MRKFTRVVTSGRRKPKPCAFCKKVYLPKHGLSIYCSGSCKHDAQVHNKRERYAAGFHYRRDPNARYFPKQCSNCSDVFQPKSGRDHLCLLCKQKRERWQEDIVTALIRTCKNRFKVECDLTRDWFEKCWREQQGRCAISGLLMVRERSEGAGNICGTDGTKVSIDRIDSDKPYVQSNCRLVCVMVNIMRHRLSDALFLGWCQKILKNNGWIVLPASVYERP